jgi:hypothetical protein
MKKEMLLQSGGFAKKKPRFAGKNHGIVSMARSVCIMYRPVGIWMLCRPTKRPDHVVKNPETHYKTSDL